MKLVKIVTTGALLGACSILFTGCDPANIQAQMRVPELAGVKTRCVEIDMRSNKQMEETFHKYDGWRVFYISEFTTSNRFGTSATVCFEKSFSEETEATTEK